MPPRRGARSLVEEDHGAAAASSKRFRRRLSVFARTSKCASTQASRGPSQGLAEGVVAREPTQRGHSRPRAWSTAMTSPVSPSRIPPRSSPRWARRGPPARLAAIASAITFGRPSRSPLGATTPVWIRTIGPAEVLPDLMGRDLAGEGDPVGEAPGGAPSSQGGERRGPSPTILAVELDACGRLERRVDPAQRSSPFFSTRRSESQKAGGPARAWSGLRAGSLSRPLRMQTTFSAWQFALGDARRAGELRGRVDEYGGFELLPEPPDAPPCSNTS